MTPARPKPPVGTRTRADHGVTSSEQGWALFVVPHTPVAGYDGGLLGERAAPVFESKEGVTVATSGERCGGSLNGKSQQACSHTRIFDQSLAGFEPTPLTALREIFRTSSRVQGTRDARPGCSHRPVAPSRPVGYPRAQRPGGGPAHRPRAWGRRHLSGHPFDALVDRSWIAIGAAAEVPNERAALDGGALRGSNTRGARAVLYEDGL